MTKQEKTALNMAKFIKEQSLLLLDKLNELDMDTRPTCASGYTRMRKHSGR